MKITILATGMACLLVSQAAATTFDAYYGFGDSTLDSGWWSGCPFNAQDAQQQVTHNIN
jgi:hypothetical protein